MPKVPRDVDGADLVKKLHRLGYEQTRQTGSNIMLTCKKGAQEHHITIPAHSPLKIGTLNAILEDITSFFAIEKEELIHQIFG
jgi:predicted RNA binding protein YcfA (HicA-like mRNA interferase family)